MTSKPKKSESKALTPPFSQEVGKTLRQKRLDLGITLDEVAAETKIQKPYLKAIEQSDWPKLPHSVQSLGFIKKYARLLGLDDKTAASKYLLQRGDLKNSKSRLFKIQVKPPIIGTRLIAGLIFGATVLTVGAYLIWQLTILTSPPRLHIDQPADNTITTSQHIQVEGTTTPGVELKVDGQVVYVDDNGRFKAPLVLKPGVNLIKIDATNRKQQVSTVEKTVYYQVE